MQVLYLDNFPAVTSQAGWAHAGATQYLNLGLYTTPVASDTLQLLGMNILDDSSVLVTSVEAQKWYNLDVGWSLKPGISARAVATTLTAEGVSFDRAFGGGGGVGLLSTTDTSGNLRHTIDTGGRNSIDMGWSPDNDGVYLTPYDAALGFWRVLFPSEGVYVFILAGVGQSSVVATGATFIVTPTIHCLKMNPLNRQLSILVSIDFSGTYPSGGLDVPAGFIGRETYLFADINEDPPYQFSFDFVPDNNKLKVYRAGAGEVAVGEALTFSTRALFIGP